LLRPPGEKNDRGVKKVSNVPGIELLLFCNDERSNGATGEYGLQPKRDFRLSNWNVQPLEETNMSWKTYIVTATSLSAYIAVMTYIMQSFFPA
jgi:hypothetical protein